MEGTPAVENTTATIVGETPAVANTVPTDIPVNFTVAEDCVYVMFKDKKIVTLYLNDFNGLEVTEQVMDPNEHPDLANRIGGLALLYRWRGVENMMHSRF